MIVQNASQPMRQIIRYEEQLKQVSQRIEILILDGNPEQIQEMKDLIGQEQQLMKYLQVQSCNLNPQSRQIYTKNLSRYRKKAKQHREYLTSVYGARVLPPKSKSAMFIDYQNQNDMLAQNKMTMYQNKDVQEGMNRELNDQGQKLYAGIEQNREIRREADTAEGAIKLIKMSILKRKLMFGSLVLLFGIVMIAVAIIKAHRK